MEETIGVFKLLAAPFTAIGGIIVYLVRMEGRVSRNAEQLADLKRTVEAQAIVLQDVAVIRERVGNVQKNIEDIKDALKEISQRQLDQSTH